MAVESPPWATQAGTFSAEQTRRAILSQYARAANSPGILAGGLIGASDLQLSAPVSGMSVNVSTGEAIIPGTEGGSQGGYYAFATSQTNLAIATANPSNPRIDFVCGTSADAGYTLPTGGTSGQWSLQVVTGTPTSGASLANLSGAPTLPGSSLLLGYVLVPAGSTSIVSADIANKAQLVSLQPINQWSTYTPSWVNVTSPTTIVARYLQIGKLCAVHIQPSWSSAPGGSGAITVSLPVQAANQGLQALSLFNNITSTALTGVATVAASGTVATPQTPSSSATSALGTISAGSITLGGNFVIQGVYETV